MMIAKRSELVVERVLRLSTMGELEFDGALVWHNRPQPNVWS